MKKILLASTATCIAMLTLWNAGYSQKASPTIVYNSKEFKTPDASPGNNDATETSVDEIAINSKALKDFRKSFSAVNGEKWFIVKTGFTTKFTLDNVQYRVDYSKKGQWKGTMKQYDEKKLSRDVRATVKRTYFDYSITWVKEITVPDYPATIVYIIHIEDEKSFKNLQLVDGEIVVLEAYDKG